MLCVGAAGCGAVCTGVLHWALLRLNKRRYPVLSVKASLLRMMDSSSIGHIMLSKEEKSSFILKQKRQLQLQLRPTRSSARSWGSATLSTETRLSAFRLEVYLIYSCPSAISHQHTHTCIHTGSSQGKHCSLWVSSGLQRNRLPWRLVKKFHRQIASTLLKSRYSFHLLNLTFRSVHNACLFQILDPNRDRWMSCWDCFSFSNPGYVLVKGHI